MEDIHVVVSSSSSNNNNNNNNNNNSNMQNDENIKIMDDKDESNEISENNNNNNVMVPEDPRQRAIREAEETLRAMNEHETNPLADSYQHHHHHQQQQHTQHPSSYNYSYSASSSSHLDGFNLLGVIANPRGTGPLVAAPFSASASEAAASAYHGRYYSSSSSSPRHDHHHHGGGGGGTDVLTDTYLSFESTLTSVTEQLEAMNAVLENWSRQILEDTTGSSSSSTAAGGGAAGSGGSRHYFYYAGSDHDPSLPESILKELPLELQNLDLQSLQAYIEASGAAAQAFRQRHEEDYPDSMNGTEDGATTLMSTKLERARNAANMSQQEVEQEIPPLFFSADFDLTDPDTFRDLLLSSRPQQQPQKRQQRRRRSSASGSVSHDDENGGTGQHPLPTSGTGSQGDSHRHPPETLSANIHDWFVLPPQDAFSGLLDKVEIALLQQVRSKSDAFFQESLRFAQLQEWIQALLKQVVDLQGVTRYLNHDLLEPMELVPLQDTQRADLQSLLDVLDTTNELLRCKSSIAGLLSAQDDLGAIEQIQYGRRLLAGEVAFNVTSTKEEDNEKSATAAAAAMDEYPVELRRLAALRSVSEQLKQYEQLVVTNLRDELVEIFLEWNSAAVSAIYATSNGGVSNPTTAQTPSGSGSSAPTFTSHKSSHHVQQRVREIYSALQKCRAKRETRESYSKRLQDMIRMTVRTTVGEFAIDSMPSTGSTTPAVASISSGATAMSLDRFFDCLDMLFEQLLALMTSASGVNDFCIAEGFVFDDSRDESDGVEKSLKASASFDQSASAGSGTTIAVDRESPMFSVVAAAAELSSKSISELLRLRKEAHSVISLEEMKRLWDKCTSFSTHAEELCGHKAAALRSTLLAQAKAFVENKHERNMAALVAALDSERWIQCDVSSERQDVLTRLCQGRSVAPQSSSFLPVALETKSHEAEVEGTRYKVVWSCLLLLEMVINDIGAATYFSSLSSNLVAKVGELLRLFNSRTTHLVLGGLV